MGLEYYDLAIKDKDAAIKLNSTRDFIWFDKGLLLYEQKIYKEAIEAFDRVIQLNETDRTDSEILNESKDLRQEVIQRAQKANS